MSYTPDDIIRITARMLQGTDVRENVFHVKMVSIGTPIADAVYDPIVAAFMDTAYLEMVPSIWQGISFVDVAIQNITENSPTRFIPWPTLTVGTRAGVAMPGQIAGMCSFPSERAKSVGRKYLPGAVEEDSVPDGIPAAGYVTALADFAAEFLDAIISGQAELLFGNYDNDTLQFAVWIAANAATFWATQRRRRVGVGS